MKSRPRLMLLCAAVALLGMICGTRADVGPEAAACDPAYGGDGCACDQCMCDRCCLVPDVKTTKKWVYRTKLVPYCLTKCPNPLKCRHDSCETCPTCEDCVRYKRVLIKREVVTKKSGYKCVPGCEACRSRGATAATPPDAYLPEPPPIPAAPPAPTALKDRLRSLFQ